MTKALVILAALLIPSPAATEPLRPTLATCSAAFARSDEPRAAAAAVKIGLLAFAKFKSLPEGERQGYEEQMKAERLAALRIDTSAILEECYGQID